MVYQADGVPLEEVCVAIGEHFKDTPVGALWGPPSLSGDSHGRPDLETQSVRVSLDAGSYLEAVAQLSRQTGVGWYTRHANNLDWYLPAVREYAMAGPAVVAVFGPAKLKEFKTNRWAPQRRELLALRLSLVYPVRQENPAQRGWSHRSGPIEVLDQGRIVEPLDSDSGGSSSGYSNRYYLVEDDCGGREVEIRGHVAHVVQGNPRSGSLLLVKGASTQIGPATVTVTDVDLTNAKPEATLEIKYPTPATPDQLALLAGKPRWSDRDRYWKVAFPDMKSGDEEALRRRWGSPWAALRVRWTQYVLGMRGFRVTRMFGGEIETQCMWGHHWEGDREVCTLDLSDPAAPGPRPSLAGATLSFEIQDRRVEITPFSIPGVSLRPEPPSGTNPGR
ncbi:MAG: hypothetical protein AAGK14_00125 [Verrucomicrobiota bacterium]